MGHHVLRDKNLNYMHKKINWRAKHNRNMATPLSSTNDNSIVWMTSQTDLLDRQDDMSHDKEERIVTILGMGLLDRQELRDVLDSCNLDLLDDDSSFEDSYANDSLDIARRARNDRMIGGVGDRSSGRDSMSATLDSPPVDAAFAKDTLEVEYSPALWKLVDNSMMDIKKMPSNQMPVATGGLSKSMPIKYSNSAA